MEIEFIARWIHVMAGIAWIGILYFFNFVNVPLQGALDDTGKSSVNPHMMPRALWWFRWGAMITFLAGLYLYKAVYIDKGLLKAGMMAGRNMWIHAGMLCGIIMWFNVWFIIWPAQKKILGGTAGDAKAALAGRAKMFSRVNTYLSGPMLFGMFGGAHADMAGSPTHMAIYMVAGLVIVHIAIIASFKVGKSV